MCLCYLYMCSIHDVSMVSIGGVDKLYRDIIRGLWQGIIEWEATQTQQTIPERRTKQ